MIDYYLPAVPAGPVVMEILDAKGAVVNRYSSDAAARRGCWRARRSRWRGGGAAVAVRGAARIRTIPMRRRRRPRRSRRRRCGARASSPRTSKA